MERVSGREVIASVFIINIVHMNSFNEFLTKCEFGWYLKEGG